MSAPRLSSSRRLGLVCLLVAGLGWGASSAVAAPTDMVDLGHASSYAALSGASVANTVSAAGMPFTTLRGDLGVNANAQPTGFPPGIVTGTRNIGNAAAAQAHADLVTAYTEVKGRTGGTTLAGALIGATILPGLHTVAGAVSNTGTVTFDGQDDPDAVFVVQVGAALDMAAGSHVALVHGARASRIFWQVNGAGTIGANATFAGTLMALDAVGVGNGSVVNGRLFARNGALAVDANDVYSSPPVVTIAGGASATTTNTTPTITGTTDVEAPAVVTVTVGGQTLTATPSAGAWSVTSTLLANATYPVVASVTDGAGNPGSATQQLTVDTLPPVVTLDGGPSLLTNDSTPTLAGTTDVAAGATVHLAIGAQTLDALVQPGGTWNVTPSTLSDGTRTVTASVLDPAGNPGTDSQTLTVDTVAPGAAIAGGTAALTDDATPDISGTADVDAGTIVTVTLADETLTAAVQVGGTWSATASALSDGPHRVVMHVSDAAENSTSLTQTLTVDTVAPGMAITGGAMATTTDVAPTITGTSDAAPGTIVTVSIAGQTMTTLLQANGTWNATPTRVGPGTWSVVASAPDPAGNVGSAAQVLEIVADVPPGSGDGPPVGPVSPAGPVTPIPGPGTTPAPGPTPGGGATTVAARATVARSTTQRLKGSSLSLGTKVTAPAGGRVVATAKGTVRIRGSKKAIALTTVTKKLAAGRSATLTVKPKGTKKTVAAAFKSIAAAVRKGTKVTATIAVKLVDAAGHSRTVTRTVKLTKK